MDAVSDGSQVFIGAIMQQLEFTGIHSGDSCCFISPRGLGDHIEKQIYDCTLKLSKALQIKGFINIQFAIKNNQIFIIEVNPRASRTVPYVAKSTGIPLVKLAIQCMLGYSLNLSKEKAENHLYTVKIPVFSFDKFPEITPQKGPEMLSTGEVMGTGASLKEAFFKAKLASAQKMIHQNELYDPFLFESFLSEKETITYELYTLQEGLLGFK